MIPLINITPLFGPPGAGRDAVDAAIMEAAAGTGFMAITGPPAIVPATPAIRAALLRLFTLSPAQTARLARRTFVPGNPNIYRGWFPLQPGNATYKEGIDIGPDIAHPAVASDDPLQEPTPRPSESDLPDWRAAAAEYYHGMEALGRMVMRAVARGLGLPETQFDTAFAGGISTLRLIHYPRRTPESFEGAADAWVMHAGERRPVTGAAHVDSGFLTLLAQDGVAGLQAQDASGAWIDVPPEEGTLAVNFGGLLERWSGGRIKATRHRVLGSDRARYSIPFFYEARPDAEIAPLPGAAPFAAFTYGDHLWAAMCAFVEFRGLEGARVPSRTLAEG